jgi:hypothetical protein
MKRFEERRGQELAQLLCVFREGLTHVAIVIEDAPPDLGDRAMDWAPDGRGLAPRWIGAFQSAMRDAPVVVPV